jgi:hypothetical protein
MDAPAPDGDAGFRWIDTVAKCRAFAVNSDSTTRNQFIRCTARCDAAVSEKFIEPNFHCLSVLGAFL